MNGLVPALMAGGFSGSTDCRGDKLSIRYVGEVRKLGRTFRIYANRYKLKPPCPECAIHGGQRIIFIEQGRYMGQYRADFADASVREGRLVLVRTDFADAKPVTVDFTAKGPPAKQWDGGEVLLFFR
jgi:hypothetical protein